MTSDKNARPPVLSGCSVLPPLELSTPQPALNGKASKTPKRTAITANRFGELNAFVDSSMAVLSRAELGTWLVLWRDTKNGTARTSMQDVARRIGASKRAVVDAVASLENRGFLTVIYRGGMRRGMNVYRVNSLAKPSG